jgi:hypothetical protein
VKDPEEKSVTRVSEETKTTVDVSTENTQHTIIIHTVRV